MEATMRKGSSVFKKVILNFRIGRILEMKGKKPTFNTQNKCNGVILFYREGV